MYIYIYILYSMCILYIPRPSKGHVFLCMSYASNFTGELRCECCHTLCVANRGRLSFDSEVYLRAGAASFICTTRIMDLATWMCIPLKIRG